MCQSPNYLAILKKEYDYKYHATGKRTRGIIVGSVRNCGKMIKTYDTIKFEKSEKSFPLEFYDVLIVNCNQCHTCRLNKTKAKAIQVYGEVFSNELNGLPNCFITLTFGWQQTYNYLRAVRKMSRYKAKKYTDFLCWSLENREYTLFQKRLRKKFPGCNIRFFHCGEYGSKNTKRPHHHAIILGFDFADKQYFFTNKDTGVNYYRSAVLEDLWPFGYSTIGEVSFNSCAYVSRYVTKKINGALSETYYNGRKPEYCTMSNRPGIGFKFYQDNKKNIYDLDSVTMLNWKNKPVTTRPPKYFDELLKRDDFQLYEQIKDRRLNYAKDNIEDSYVDALRGMTHDEFITAQKLSKLNHDFDEDHVQSNINMCPILTYRDFKYRNSNDVYKKYNDELLKRLRRNCRDKFNVVDEELVKKLYSENRLYYSRGRTIEPYALLRIGD